ncbi:MAG: polysaccharide deacetylase family protein [Patescibacteria group bacterium]
MSLPQTGCGPSLFWVAAGLILLLKNTLVAALKFFKRLLCLFFLVALITFPSQASGFLAGSHWDSFGNDDGWVFRGATEQRFSPFQRGGINLSFRVGENHAFGLDQTKNWNRKFEIGLGPLLAYNFWRPEINGLVRLGGDVSYGLRPDISCFNITPFFDFWLGWKLKKFNGSFSGVVRNEGFGEGVVGRLFIGPGFEITRFGSGSATLIAQTVFQGVHGVKPYPWNRKVEIGGGPKLMLGPCEVFCHYAWSKQPNQTIREVRVQISWWIGWNLSRRQPLVDRRVRQSGAALALPKKIYLTIDGGIGGEKIDSFLSLLKSHDVRATFFLVGEEVVRIPNMVQKIEKDGHALGNHTWSHRDLTQLSESEILAEVQRVDSLAGRKLRLVRPPYSKIDGWTLSVLQAAGYQVCLYTIDPKDWEESCTAESIVARVEEGLDRGRDLNRDSEIIILHLAGANGSPALEALPRVIELCRERGYEFFLPSNR